MRQARSGTALMASCHQSRRVGVSGREQARDFGNWMAALGLAALHRLAGQRRGLPRVGCFGNALALPARLPTRWRAGGSSAGSDLLVGEACRRHPGKAPKRTGEVALVEKSETCRQV